MSCKGIEYSEIIKYNKKESGILAQLNVSGVIWGKVEKSVYNTIEIKGVFAVQSYKGEKFISMKKIKLKYIKSKKEK